MEQPSGISGYLRLTEMEEEEDPVIVVWLLLLFVDSERNMQMSSPWSLILSEITVARNVYIHWIENRERSQVKIWQNAIVVTWLLPGAVQH